MRQPRFSVVIPTRNRAALLPSAIRSALAQTFDRFELIVVNNASTDGTAAVLTQFTDLRMRAVHSPNARLMHDNWMFALAQARGEYVLFLCDDDAWHPRLLEIVDRAVARTHADVVCWRSITHYSDDWFQPNQRGMVSLGPPFSDGLFDVNAAALLDAAFDMRVTITDIVPRMLNSAISADLIQRLGHDGVRLFRPCNPDYSCFMAMATVARRMIYLDAPLLVSGATPHSVGASASQRGETARRFLEELFALEPDLLLPPSPRTPAVWIGQTYMQCAREIPALHDRQVNLVHMYGIAGQEIERFAASADVSDWRRQLEETLAGPCADQRDRIKVFIEQKRVIETDRFLVPTGAWPALGIGPKLVADVRAQDLGANTIDEVAVALDQWIVRGGSSLNDLWDDCAIRCGKRLCVVIGLGLNGRAALRTPPSPTHVLRGRIHSHDDRSDYAHRAAPRIDGFNALDPQRHFVMVTPTSCDGLIARLRQRGFSSDDMVTLAASARAPAARRSVSLAAASTPSGCR